MLFEEWCIYVMLMLRMLYGISNTIRKLSDQILLLILQQGYVYLYIGFYIYS